MSCFFMGFLCDASNAQQVLLITALVKMNTRKTHWIIESHNMVTKPAWLQLAYKEREILPKSYSNTEVT